MEQNYAHTMVTWDELHELAMSLPEVSQMTDRKGIRQWRVKDKLIVWERPLRAQRAAVLPLAGGRYLRTPPGGRR